MFAKSFFNHAPSYDSPFSSNLAARDGKMRGERPGVGDQRSGMCWELRLARNPFVPSPKSLTPSPQIQLCNNRRHANQANLPKQRESSGARGRGSGRSRSDTVGRANGGTRMSAQTKKLTSRDSNTQLDQSQRMIKLSKMTKLEEGSGVRGQECVSWR